MNSHPQRRHFSTKGFTLVELLTVIAIIAILMGLLFPAIQIAKEQARKAQAKVDVAAICSAVKAYYAEYGKYPLGNNASTSNPSDILYGENGNDNYQLFDILRNTDSTGGTAAGQPNQYNPRAIVFFDGKTATDPVNPRAGFVPSGSSGTNHAGCYMDPWGSQYRVAIDGDYDNQITNLMYTDFSGTTNGPRTGVVAYSLGKDLKLGTNGDQTYKLPSPAQVSDDIVSWQ